MAPARASRVSGRRLLVATVGWLVASSVGGVIVAVPDRGPRVVALSETHGPSALDLVGIALVLAGWLPFLGCLWRARPAIPGRGALAALAAAGAVLLGWSVATDTGAWWALGAAALAAAQVLAALLAARRLADRPYGHPSADTTA